MKPILMVVWPGMEKIRFGLRDTVVVRFEASRDYNDLLNQIDEGLVSGKVVQLVYNVDCCRFLNWLQRKERSFVLQYVSDRVVYDYVDQAQRQLAEAGIDRDDAYRYASYWARECELLSGPGVSKVVINHLPTHFTALRPSAPKPKQVVRKDHW